MFRAPPQRFDLEFNHLCILRTYDKHLVFLPRVHAGRSTKERANKTSNSKVQFCCRLYVFMRRVNLCSYPVLPSLCLADAEAAMQIKIEQRET